MLIVLLVVGLGGLLVGALVALATTATARSRPPDRSDATPPPDPTAAIAAAMVEIRQQAAHDRDAAVQAALQQSAVLQREAMAQQAVAGQQELAGKKDVIDARLEQMASHLRAELGRVSEQLAQLGSVSTRSFGAVNAALAAHAETTQALATTANGLKEALASTKTRGQWGERIAEDVLRMAGFVENVDYRKQTKVEGGDGLPDFTFELPRGQVLYLDVKFPLSAYLRFLEAGNDAERSAHREAFLRDVRLRIRELAKRDYARQGARPSVDYVLLFLPNETVSSFIHENDATLLDDALKQKVVLCSPLTLFAMLGVIRQAHDNFMIEQTSDEILRVLGGFEQQWERFSGAIETVGKRLESAQRAFEELNGPRRRQLERPLAQLEHLRAQRGIALDAPDGDLTLDYGVVRELVA